MSTPVPDTVTLFTSAPECFDGHGTRTVETIVGLVDRVTGFPVRRVAILRRHLAWQVGRYDSGMGANTGGHAGFGTFIRAGVWDVTGADFDRHVHTDRCWGSPGPGYPAEIVCGLAEGDVESPADVAWLDSPDSPTS